ncbi:MAG: DpnII family type II restriction endonuclease [Candidatus Gracilibacteria bacterium]|jgi:type II restriction enzyme
MLLSRSKFKNSAEFKEGFLKTLMPGVISRKNFIQWDLIIQKTKKYKNLFEFISQLSGKNDAEFIKELSQSLQSADNPARFIKACFEFLGHTKNNYVSDIDNLKIDNFSKTISEVDANKIAQLLLDLGLKRIVDTKLPDYFLGIQIGLETNRRKNTGGKAFVNFIKIELEKIVSSLKRKGINVVLKEEEKIFYTDRKTSKKVDFCFIFSDGRKIGVEVNFYTVSGSKPTEIKRSYGEVNRSLAKVDTELVWITDGIGYEDMKRSLQEAFEIHQNTYNSQMMKTCLEEDLVNFFHG